MEHKHWQHTHHIHKPPSRVRKNRLMFTRSLSEYIIFIVTLHLENKHYVPCIQVPLLLLDILRCDAL